MHTRVPLFYFIKQIRLCDEIELVFYIYLQTPLILFGHSFYIYEEGGIIAALRFYRKGMNVIVKANLNTCIHTVLVRSDFHPFFYLRKMLLMLMKILKYCNKIMR